MILGPQPGPLDDAGLARAYDWQDGPCLRALMLTTLDGAAAGADGHSRSISTPADRDVMSAVRRLADAVVVGAGTLRAERYGPLHAQPDAVPERRAQGLADAVRLVVVTASLDLPWDWEVFTASDVPPLVVTAQGADPERLRAAQDRTDVDVVAAADGGVDPGAAVAALHARGLHRLVSEGGPGLLARFAKAGLVDETCITLAPRIVGGGQVVTGEASAHPARFDLVHVLEDDGFLFTRARRRQG
jgi:riboflavin biosynthesis pyrimidine reductase